MSDDCVVVCFYNGKKIRIYYLPYNSIEAEASLSSAYIVLSEKLKNYPELHDFILNHELGHFRYGYNVVKQLLHDWKDVVRFYTNGKLVDARMRFESSIRRKMKEKLKIWGFEIIYIFGTMVTCFLHLVLGIPSFIYFTLKRRLKNG